MRKKGVALLLALFTLSIASLLVVAFLELTTTDLQIVSNHNLRNQALYIADAGVEYAIYQLRNNKNWSGTGGTVELPSGSGNNYNVTCSNISGKITITSIGSLATGEQITLEVRASVTGSIPYKVKIIYWREL